MPRTCLACSSPNRSAIDKAIVSGEPLRNIAKRVSISLAALFRHKTHAAQALVKAGGRREERLGDSLLDEMRRVQRKAWELLARTESEGDHRGAIVALREVHECLESLGEMLSRAAAEGAGPLSGYTSDELKAELDRRGDREIVEFIVSELGVAPTHKWRELPASSLALLPGRPKGTLYVCRELSEEERRERETRRQSSSQSFGTLQ
jgi:transposase